MPVATTLLRVLLILSLALNSSGYAFASAHLQMSGHASSTAAGNHAHGAQQATAPCHGETMADAVEATGPAGLAILGDDHQSPQPSDPDCCQSGNCRCACLHGGAAATAIATDGAMLPMHSSSASRLVHAHVAPVLPHLIRPPIG